VEKRRKMATSFVGACFYEFIIIFFWSFSENCVGVGALALCGWRLGAANFLEESPHPAWSAAVLIVLDFVA
jgi:hypothetical protein